MNWQDKLIQFGIDYGGKLIAALLIFFIGRWVIKIIVNRFDKHGRETLDETLRPFIKSILSTILYILLFITIGSTIGIKMTSFVAIFGAAGLAVGLALQGSLANFAGGVLILTFRPFNVGDFVEVSGGERGKVTSIKILYTTLSTKDNKKIIIPNGNLSNNTIINYTVQDQRRVDLQFGIGYDDDFQQAKEILHNIVDEHEKVLKEPAPLIRVGEHGGSSININCYVWCKTEDYWDVYYDLMEAVKTAFDEEGINIPYPQMDVHLDQ